MTGIQAQNLSQKKDPATPPPEYSATEQVSEKPLHYPDAANVDVVTAAIPLLQSHVLQAGEKLPIVEPPEYTEVDILDSKEATTEGNDGEEEEDHWRMPELEDSGPSWSELDTWGRVKLVVVGYIGKVLCLLALLYLFICSLDFLSSGFRLIGGKAAGEAFRSSSLLANPVAGLMIGILATVLVQSSSTSTSIVVTMVASGIMEVRPAIPIVMGANIGTSVTNTIVSMAQSADKNQFRRAFAGATVHDMFNWLSVIVLLPLEAATGYLYYATGAATNVFRTAAGEKGANRDLLKTITKPFTKIVIQLDKKVLEAMATGDEKLASQSLIKKWCSYDKTVALVNETLSVNTTSGMENATVLVNKTIKVPVEPCRFLFHDTGMSDTVVGLIMLALSLTLLCTCLIFMVKILHSMLRGRIAHVIRSTLNADFPGCLKHLTGYVAMLVGAGMTILVQSSSVFTSAMTPLVGLGVIEIERMYPLTLGSNIGTTATGVLAALAASGDRLAPALQIAFAHLFFNISGILLFYPVPVMRVPIKLAKIMGDTTAEYRWFAAAYLIAMFLLLPAAVFSLSLLGMIPLMVIIGLVFLLATFVLVVNVLQNKRPSALHPRLRCWDWLPECLRSLAPMDRVLCRMLRCCPCACLKQSKPTPEQLTGEPALTEAAERLTSGAAEPPTVAIEMTDSATPSPNTSATNSQATSVCSSRSTSLLILPKSSVL